MATIYSAEWTDTTPLCPCQTLKLADVVAEVHNQRDVICCLYCWPDSWRWRRNRCRDPFRRLIISSIINSILKSKTICISRVVCQVENDKATERNELSSKPLRSSMQADISSEVTESVTNTRQTPPKKLYKNNENDEIKKSHPAWIFFANSSWELREQQLIIGVFGSPPSIRRAAWPVGGPLLSVAPPRVSQKWLVMFNLHKSWRHLLHRPACGKIPERGEKEKQPLHDSCCLLAPCRSWTPYSVHAEMLCCAVNILLPLTGRFGARHSEFRSVAFGCPLGRWQPITSLPPLFYGTMQA